VFAKQIILHYPEMEPRLAAVKDIAFPWYVLIGTTITVSVGFLSSLIGPPALAPAVLGRPAFVPRSSAAEAE
jgi:hypothetical protein